jgi:cytochrome c-type biogenesis protein CcmE
MNPIRKRRLIFVMLLMSASLIAAYLIIEALRQNINFFFTPTQVVKGEAKVGPQVRVGGMIVKGSVLRKAGLEVQFLVTDFNHTVLVHYTGILPDLFKEGQGIVALGHLTPDNHFWADEVLAKHDENYMPPELRDTLKREQDKAL